VMAGSRAAGDCCFAGWLFCVSIWDFSCHTRISSSQYYRVKFNRFYKSCSHSTHSHGDANNMEILAKKKHRKKIIIKKKLTIQHNMRFLPLVLAQL
jgi:precorrin-6B methylase 1